MLHQLYAAARNLTARFLSDRTGNVAMMFAATAVPLLVATGGLIDYTRMWTVQTKMQDAADAAATMLSRDASTLTAAQLQSQANAFFLANFSSQDTSALTVTPTYSSIGPMVTIKASTSMKAYFLPLIGISTVPLETSSTVVWGQSLLRVALVLDTTGSMKDDGKIDALKIATKNLLDKLKASATKPGDVYVSIIPFSKDVNVGPSNYNASWIRWDLWDEVNGSCSKSSHNTKSKCESKGEDWTADDHKTWNGCVTDRDQSYDTTNDAPVSTAKMFPAEQYGNCPPTPWIGLTYDWTALTAKVEALTPNGNTNQGIGLQWGWQSLTAAPFTIPPLDADKEYKQVIILLTDGMNTENRWYTNEKSIDAREKLTCANLDETDIAVYTIQVNTGKDPTSELLQDCAVNGGSNFMLTSADQIISAFDSIGTSLSQLRISQ